MKKNISLNLVRGTVFAFLAIVLLLVTPSQISIKFEQGQAVNSRTFPYIVFGLMLVCSVWLIIKGLRDTSGEKVEISLKTLQTWGIPLLFLGIVFIYALLMYYIGYILSSIIVANGILLLFKCRKVSIYLICNVTIFVIFFVFTRLIDVILPSLIL